MNTDYIPSERNTFINKKTQNIQAFEWNYRLLEFLYQSTCEELDRTLPIYIGKKRKIKLNKLRKL